MAADGERFKIQAPRIGGESQAFADRGGGNSFGAVFRVGTVVAYIGYRKDTGDPDIGQVAAFQAELVRQRPAGQEQTATLR